MWYRLSSVKLVSASQLTSESTGIRLAGTGSAGGKSSVGVKKGIGVG